MSNHWGATGGSAAVVALALLGLAGCGGGGLKTYPVKGKVVLANGDVGQLAGSNIEFMLESDPTIRADGKIEPDGSFSVQTLYKGKVLRGAPEGTYQARIILSEPEDDNPRKPRPRPIHQRFLDFKSSGLSLKVPTSGDVTLNVSGR